MRLLPLFRRKRTSRRNPTHRRSDGISQSPEEWRGRVMGIVEGLPWFGQKIDAPARPRRRPGERLNSDDHRRVLLSWLAGGSAEQKARRAGVGRRTAYKVLEEVIYTSDPVRAMPYWWKLGLITCFITPWCQEVERSGFQQVVCLICHNLVVSYDIANRYLPVGRVFKPTPEAHLVTRKTSITNTWRTTQRSQGHLILHFWVDEDPMYEGAPFQSRVQSGIWRGVGRRALDYVDEFFYLRESSTRPFGKAIDDDAEEWRKWRLGILETGRAGLLPSRPLRPHER